MDSLAELTTNFVRNFTWECCSFGLWDFSVICIQQSCMQQSVKFSWNCYYHSFFFFTPLITYFYSIFFLKPSLSTPFLPSQPTQSAGGFGFGNFGQLQTASANVFGGTSSIFGHGTVGQPSGTQSSAVAQSALATNPFGTLPAMPQISIGRTDTSPSIQYGISSLPVVDKPVPIRISSFLTSRHLSHRCIRLPARKYHPKNDGPKVPFFSDDEETPSTPKADALYIPRENPRSLEIRPLEQISSRASSEKRSPSNPKATTPVHENGKQL
ncbi:nuclear pore complex protein NUP98A-like isoform X2 [Olea europaea var. sylvestris]|uniref:nuclear pore complex protein NUP98A-like isoform X2 n=1 Tax=Olea europaea var. sylvestris TaxID=158386 RepID=UPI000C1D77FD|nr:nuclear pore complex protein NUP98A-like isoform X2 [Olea europaea var. sylvestris]